MTTATPNDWQFLTVLRTYLSEHGRPPSVRELADTTGYSVSVTHGRLTRLSALGLVRTEPGKARALHLLSCPTCSGPERETVGMVCQTCGTDYSAPASPVELDFDALDDLYASVADLASEGFGSGRRALWERRRSALANALTELRDRRPAGTPV